MAAWKWTAERRQFIKDNAELSNSELATRFNRKFKTSHTPHNIAQQKYFLGIRSIPAWTSDEIADLTSWKTQGHSAAQIRDMIREKYGHARTVGAIHRKVVHTPAVCPKTRWSDDDLGVLEDLFKQGFSQAQVIRHFEEIGRPKSQSTVQYQMMKNCFLRLVVRRWTLEEETRAKALVEEGKIPRVIAKTLSREFKCEVSTRRVEQKIRREKWCRK